MNSLLQNFLLATVLPDIVFPLLIALVAILGRATGSFSLDCP